MHETKIYIAVAFHGVEMVSQQANPGSRYLGAGSGTPCTSCLSRS